MRGRSTAVPSLVAVDSATLVDRKTGVEYGAGDGAAKAWAFIEYNGAVATLAASFGVADIDDTGTGNVLLTWTTPFANATYVVVATVATSGNDFAIVSAITTTTARVLVRDTPTGGPADPTIGLMVVAFGVQ